MQELPNFFLAFERAVKYLGTPGDALASCQ